MITEFKTGPLRESKFAELLRECIDLSDDSNFDKVDFDFDNLYYVVPWMNRIVVLDSRTKSVKYDGNGWGFRSIRSAARFAQSRNQCTYHLSDIDEDESSRTGVDFWDLC